MVIFKNSLVSLILCGSYDGEIINAPLRCKYHIDAFRDIYGEMLKAGKYIKPYNIMCDSEACFDLLTQGQVIIKTVATDSFSIFFIYIPDNISIKQLEVLRSNVYQFEGSEIYFCKLKGEVIGMKQVDDLKSVLVK